MLRISTAARRSLERQSRSIWTTTTLTSTSAHSLISSIPSSSSTSSQFTLYTLSKHFPQSLLPSLQSSLSSSPSIGCLSEPLPSSSSDSPPFTLSLAHWSPSTAQEMLISFSTTLTGRPNVSLGREHKPRAGGRMSEMEQEFEERQFEKFLSGDKGWAFGDSVEAIKRTGVVGEVGGEKRGVVVEELKDVKPEDVKQIICFTADRIQPFLSALSAYPNSSTLGMTSTSTPFHSAQNHPFSLFHNSTTTSLGAVGIAIIDDSTSSSSAAKQEEQVKVDYGNLEQFGPEVKVTSARGNIILTFSERNAAALLLSLVQSLPSSTPLIGEHTDSSSPFEASLSNPNERTTKHISKDKDFYAAISSGGEVGEGRRELGKSKLVCRIMAGDPKRGAVSFETEEEIKNGDKVIFLHRPNSAPRAEKPFGNGKGFQFTTIPPSYVPPQATPAENEPDSEVEERKGVFLGYTENGIIVSRRNENGVEVRLAGIEGTSVGLEV